MINVHVELCIKYGVDPTSTEAYPLLVERLKNTLWDAKNRTDITSASFVESPGDLIERLKNALNSAYPREEIDLEDIREAITAFERADKKVTMPDALGLAVAFHTTYERLAPAFGYETRGDTKKFDPTSANGRLMVAVCKEILSLSLAEQPEGMVKK